MTMPGAAGRARGSNPRRAGFDSSAGCDDVQRFEADTGSRLADWQRDIAAAYIAGHQMSQVQARVISRQEAKRQLRALITGLDEWLAR